MTKTIYVDESTYKFQIWDTAGQEKVSCRENYKLFRAGAGNIFSTTFC